MSDEMQLLFLSLQILSLSFISVFDEIDYWRLTLTSLCFIITFYTKVSQHSVPIYLVYIINDRDICILDFRNLESQHQLIITWPIKFIGEWAFFWLSSHSSTKTKQFAFNAQSSKLKYSYFRSSNIGINMNSDK